MEQPALLRHVGSTAASLHASSGLGWKGRTVRGITSTMLVRASEW
jgi:hypothetical protein